MSAHSFQHVTDTALWVAAYRAQESLEENAAFRDPLAAVLAGERGLSLARSMPDAESLAFAMIVRTSAIDRLIEKSIAAGVRTIINLGAGLDTRPYRMNLPSELRWIEADFPGLMDYKSEVLHAHQPACRLERIKVDLTQDTERRRFLDGLNLGTDPVLVITEGVIAYLTNNEAERLARDLASTPGITYWILDYKKGLLNQRSEKKVSESLGRASFRFTERDPISFFRSQQWHLEENIGILDEAERIGKRLPMKFPWSWISRVVPGLIRSLANRTYGYGLFRLVQESTK